ncbi:MAG: hypothetical protein ACRDCH_00085 [Metamycoplasmataceae bacterium]
MEKIIEGIKKINAAWRDYKVVIKQVEIKGKIPGTFEGELETMATSKKITLNDLFKKIESMDKKFESINKKLELIDKKIEVMNKKIDLILATPTMQREIDHKALSELD